MMLPGQQGQVKPEEECAAQEKEEQNLIPVIQRQRL